MDRNNVLPGVHAQFVILAVTVLTMVGAGCGGDRDSSNESLRTGSENTAAMLADENEELNQATLDTLRAMKERFKVTRDEYWDGTGGVLANDYIEVWYPPGKFTVTQAMYTLRELRKARAEFREIFGRDPGDRLKVICANTMESYTERTGNAWWLLLKVDEDTVTFQPIRILKQRNLLDIAVNRGYFEWGIARLAGWRAPQWLVLGMASLQSGEDWVLENQLTEFPDAPVKMGLSEIESALQEGADRKAYRIANYDAYRMVRRLVAKHGRGKIATAVKAMGEGDSPRKAFEDVFGEPYESVVAYALDFTVNL